MKDIPLAQVKDIDGNTFIINLAQVISFMHDKSKGEPRYWIDVVNSPSIEITEAEYDKLDLQGISLLPMISVDETFYALNPAHITRISHNEEKSVFAIGIAQRPSIAVTAEQMEAFAKAQGV